MLHPANLPDAAELARSGQLANFSFGQGSLLASPVQIAAMMNAIASGGVYHTPFFLECTVDETDGTAAGNACASAVEAGDRVRKMQRFCVKCFVRWWKRALHRMLPGLEGGAGGKTGTAQTGQFDAGRQQSARICGLRAFTRQKSPAGPVMVLQDGQTETAYSSAAIFARLCAMLRALA